MSYRDSFEVWEELLLCKSKQEELKELFGTIPKGDKLRDSVLDELILVTQKIVDLLKEVVALTH